MGIFVEFGGRSNEIRQVWNEKDIAGRQFSLRILSGQLIPTGEFDEVNPPSISFISYHRLNLLVENHHWSISWYSTIIFRFYYGESICGFTQS